MVVGCCWQVGPAKTLELFYFRVWPGQAAVELEEEALQTELGNWVAVQQQDPSEEEAAMQPAVRDGYDYGDGGGGAAAGSGARLPICASLSSA